MRARFVNAIQYSTDSSFNRRKRLLLFNMSSSPCFWEIKIVSHLILVSVFVTTVNSTAATHYVSRQGLMKALAFPSEIDAVVGEEIYLKIIKAVAQQTHCYYRMTGGIDIDIKMPHKQT